ncbi:hypothetical protein SELMODRAFT_19212, partial [Selaginella moellendorffii]
LNKQYSLHVHSNCNVVLYKESITIWQTNTENKGNNCYLTMQIDGNLVLYDEFHNVIWSYN